MTDEKYIVFKRDEFMAWVSDSPNSPVPVQDAVVIRKQDVFAPPALEGYANAIQCVIEVLEFDTDVKLVGLRRIADYFLEQAEDAYQMKRKLPD